jgi:hypothetical protein
MQLVPGIGNVATARMSFTTSAINYEKKPYANNHNESSVVIEKGHDTFFDDETAVTMSCDDKACHLTIAMNSEVSVPVYNKGSFQLKFDRATQKWSIQAFRHNAVPWLFCSPKEVVQHVSTILGFLVGNAEMKVTVDDKNYILDPLHDSFFQLIVQSTGRDQSQMIRGASQYAGRNDCIVDPLADVDLYSDYGSVPMD